MEQNTEGERAGPKDTGESSSSGSGIAALESKVAKEPESYEAHAALVKALRETGAEEKLQDARHQMCEKFPLPPEVWLEWIQDEEKFAEDEEDMEYIKGIYDRAVEDYLSVKIWVKYAEFMWKLRKSEKDEVEEAYQRAKRTVGFHLAEGRKFWCSYRAYKQQMKDSKPEDIRQLYMQELEIPLIGMDETMSEYITWERKASGKQPKPQLFKRYSKAKEQRDKRIDFEEKLGEYAEKPPGVAYPDLIQLWDEYIDFEIKNSKGKNFKAVKLLYERAISMCFLSDGLWSKYFAFVRNKLKELDTLESLYQRATRNCPWSVETWIGYLQTIEQNDDSKAYMTIMLKAVRCTSLPPEALVIIQLEYIDYMRRKLGVGSTQFSPSTAEVQRIVGLRAAFDMCSKSLDDVDEIKAKEHDLYFKVFAYWADVEMRCYGNAEQSRILWETLLEKNMQDSRVWKNYIHQEKIFGTLDAARTLFKRAVTALPPSDWELVPICNEWIRFERECGDLKSLAEATVRAGRRIDQVEELRRAENERLYQEQLQQQANLEAAKKLQQEEAARRRNAERNAKAGPVGSCQQREGTKPMPHDGDEKVAGTKRKRESTNSESQKRQKQSQGDGKISMDIEGKRDNPEADSSSKQKTSDVESNNEKWYLKKTDDRKEDCTVFVVGLTKNTIDQHLDDLFRSYGKIKQIRHVRDGKGKSKGYAYIQYEESKCVADAVKALNRTDFNGKEIKVSRSAPPMQSKKQKGQPPQPEPNTIFIKHLPKGEGDLKTMEAKREEEIRKHFADCGEIKAVRLATEKRKGQTFLKKIAYVEFTNPDAVKRAIKLSGTRLSNYPESKPLLIMKSCPPSKKTQILKKVPVTKRKGKKGSMITLVPRAVGQKKVKSLSRASVKSNEQNDKPTAVDQETTRVESNSKSNADFRAMLLRKK